MKYRTLALLALAVSLAPITACSVLDPGDEIETPDAALTPDTSSDTADASTDTAEPEPTLVGLEISPADPVIEVNTALTLEVTALGSDGSELPTNDVVWSSSNEDVATVNEYAKIYGRGLGTATITATLEDVSASVSVRVKGKPVETVEVIPDDRTLQIGEQVELTVFLEDVNRSAIEDERDIEFVSSAPEVAVVSPAGVVTGVSAGNATITVTCEGKSDTAAIIVEATPTNVERVEVTPASDQLVRGDTVQLQAQVFDNNGQVMSDPDLTWTSSAPDVATVDANGRVEAVGEGSATIIASSGGKSDTAYIDVDFSVSALGLGAGHGCGLVQGIAFCWGQNDHGQVGQGTTGATAALGRASTGSPLDVISLGDAHSCATDGSQAWCWGKNDAGQLGDGTTTARAVPTQVTNASDLQGVSAGAQHTCGVTNSGQVWCWGKNDAGQLGDGTTTASTSPVRAPGSSFAKVFAGAQHTCALDTAGHAYCWGKNDRGQLGVNDTNDRNNPTQVLGGYEFVTLALGDAHTCGIGTDGSTACWGANDAGQLGDGTTTERHTPILISAPVSFSRLAAGHAHTCALGPGGDVYCWGQNGAGQLGLGSTTSRPQATKISSSADFTDVTAGGAGTCALDTSGKPWCWGAPSGVRVPTKVVGF
ncbi:hypothetical protein FIV42_23995 [Persicimonas caeni]|uniref:BIG2 domain-containing protein n=1 Tax=Persicimonas caeni TaxID=2292766 RepID=A0A4Y6PZJ8_PERCE|nr:Ig-like domain-containing protein [Persicimonas caeni]QDG53693.1 hypothetical protein FIV42_23995 [Persicimonas caeni]QED34914.1 hypothetical protein FRD00_23990 [Persicimonas caeni]